MPYSETDGQAVGALLANPPIEARANPVTMSGAVSEHRARSAVPSARGRAGILGTCGVGTRNFGSSLRQLPIGGAECRSPVPRGSRALRWRWANDRSPTSSAEDTDYESGLSVGSHCLVVDGGPASYRCVERWAVADSTITIRLTTAGSDELGVTTIRIEVPGAAAAASALHRLIDDGPEVDDFTIVRRP
jgi:hypothetical protein